MRYFVRARLKPEKAAALREAIQTGTLGAGSIAGGEYLRDMAHARQYQDGTVRWVEVCYCRLPLEEENPYWEEYFDLVKIQDAHDRRQCKDVNGSEYWACSDCDCTERLEEYLTTQGPLFQEILFAEDEADSE
jgi:hypothetical protein